MEASSVGTLSCKLSNYSFNVELSLAVSVRLTYLSMLASSWTCSQQLTRQTYLIAFYSYGAHLPLGLVHICAAVSPWSSDLEIPYVLAFFRPHPQFVAPSSLY